MAGIARHLLRQMGNGLDRLAGFALHGVGHRQERGPLLGLRCAAVGLLLLAQLLGLDALAAEDVNGFGHGSDLVPAAGGGDRDIHLPGGQLLHDVGHTGQRTHHAEADGEHTTDDRRQHYGGHRPDEERIGLLAFGRGDFRRRVHLVGACDHLVDDGTMICISAGDLRIGRARHRHVALLDGGQKLCFDHVPEP
jgi:hypothetical protein